MAPAADAAACRELAELYNHDPRAALSRAISLAQAHPGSPIIFNLVGMLHRDAGDRGSKSISTQEEWEEVRHNYSTALAAYSAAARLAPRCVSTAVSHGKMLLFFNHVDKAKTEFDRAVGIKHPDDPAEANIAYGDPDPSTAMKNKRDVTLGAHDAIVYFQKHICEVYVPAEATKLLDKIKLGQQGEARREARLLADNYSFCGRTHVLLAYTDLETVGALGPTMGRRRLLDRTVSQLSSAAVNFNRSLVIGLFGAKLLFILGRYDEAENECRRALNIEHPDDPCIHDIPPESIIGEDRSDRICSVQNVLSFLDNKILCKVDELWRTRIMQEHDDTTTVVLGGLTEHCIGKALFDACMFVKRHGVWTFWICLYPQCDGKKFPEIQKLWQHLVSKHGQELWSKLQTLLGPSLSEAVLPQLENSLAGMVICQDAELHDILQLPNALLLGLATGIQQETVPDMHERKRKEANMNVEDMKKLLSLLSTSSSTKPEIEKCCSVIKELWLRVLKSCHVDSHQLIFSLAVSFFKMEVKEQAVLRDISDADIKFVVTEISGASINLDETLTTDAEAKNSKKGQSDEIIQMQISVKKLIAELKSGKLHSRGESSKPSTSAITGDGKSEATLPIIIPESPPVQTYPVHLVGGGPVPQGVVQRFAECAIEKKRVAHDKFICHICSFEGVRARATSVRFSDRIFHYTKDHRVVKNFLDCEFKECGVRVRTLYDLKLHRYFCHRLADEWWLQE